MPVPPLFGVYSARPFSAWNPADKAAGITLSNSNRTATNSSGTTSNVRGVLGHGSGVGQYHAEFVMGTLTGLIAVGIGIASADLTSAMGINALSIGAYSVGSVQYLGAGVGSCDTFGPGDTVAIELDIPGFAFYVQKLGGTGRKGPFDINNMGVADHFLMTGIPVASDSDTLNTGGTNFAITPTAGYIAWG